MIAAPHENPDYPLSAWENAVASHDTHLGYKEWTALKEVAAQRVADSVAKTMKEAEKAHTEEMRRMVYKYCDRHCRMPCDGAGNISLWDRNDGNKLVTQPCPLLQAKLREVQANAKNRKQS